MPENRENPELTPEEKGRIVRSLSDHFSRAGKNPPAPETPPSSPLDRGLEIPEHYGDDKITAMVRDPEWIFLYWELKGPKSEQVFSRAPDGSLKIRVEEMHDHAYFSVEPRGELGNWYLQVVPQGSYKAAIGVEDDTGEFHQIAESKVVSTPNDKVSDYVDPDWMLVEWEEIMRLSGLDTLLKQRREFYGASDMKTLTETWSLKRNAPSSGM